MEIQYQTQQESRFMNPIKNNLVKKILIISVVLVALVAPSSAANYAANDQVYLYDTDGAQTYYDSWTDFITQLETDLTDLHAPGSDEYLLGYRSDGTLEAYTGDLNDIDVNSDYWIAAAEVTNDPGDDGISGLTWFGQGHISTRMETGPTITFASQILVDSSTATGRWFYRQRNNFGTWGQWVEK